MTKISDEDAHKLYGITTKHEIMANGELRFRQLCEDGSAYIRTVSGESGAWQNSHFHKQVKETYIVQLGWFAYAELIDGVVSGKVYRRDEAVTTQPNIVHNVYLPEGAIIHTVKHGNTSERDWWASEQFDDMTKNITEEAILKQWK